MTANRFNHAPTIAGALVIILTALVAASNRPTRQLLTPPPPEILNSYAQAFNRLLNPIPIAPENDAAVPFKRAAAAYDNLIEVLEPQFQRDRLHSSGYSVLRYSEWLEDPAPTWHDVMLVMQDPKLESVLHELDDLADRSSAHYDPHEHPVGSGFSERFRPWLSLTRMSTGRIASTWRENRCDQAARSFEHSLALARLLSGTNSLITRDASRIAVATSCDTLLACIAFSPPPREILVRFDHALERQASWCFSDDYLDALCFATLDNYLHSRTAQGAQDWEEAKILNKALLDSVGITAAFDALNSKLKTSEKPKPKSLGVDERNARDTIQATIQAFHDLRLAARQTPLHRYQDGWRKSTTKALLGEQDTKLILFWNSSVRMVVGTDELRANILATRLILRIEMYRAVHNEYPPDLQTLLNDAPTLSQFPHSPPIALDYFTAQPWRYKRLPSEQDPCRRGFTLYSTGFTHIDRGGILCECGHSSSAAVSDWPDSAKFDYVFNDGSVILPGMPKFQPTESNTEPEW